MKKYIFISIAILILAGVCTAIFSVPKTESTPSPTPFSRHLRFFYAKKDLTVELVWTPEQHEKGLSGRASLPQDQGMLFVFPRPETPSFWMKDMLFPIDIIWIGQDNTIIGITENLTPSSYPQLYPPPKAILYALEVNAGYAKANEIKTKEVIRISDLTP